MNFKIKKTLFPLIGRYKRTIIILISIMIVFFGYKLFKPSIIPPTQEERVVEVEIIKQGTIRETVDIIGTVRASHQTFLTAKSKGILRVFSKAGQSFKKGDLIAAIDNKNIEHNYKILQEAEEIAKTQFVRANALLKSGIVNKNLLEEKKSILLEIQKRLSDAKISIEELKIYAPFDGKVGIFKLREGAEVGRESVIVNFYDPSSLLVEFDLPFSVAKQVNEGGRVFVNKQEYRLAYVQKILDEETHMCPAYVEAKCSDCLIGAAIEVTVLVREKTAAIVIPLEAVFLRGGKHCVYIVEENQAILTPVEVGIQEKKLVEITSGLNVGDKVIVQGHHYLYPFMAVKVSGQKLNNAEEDLPK